MRIDRRAMLKGSALAGAVAVLPVAANAAVAAGAVVVVDSRLAESARYGADATQRIDLAQVSLNAARQAMAGAARIEGLTRWSDWTVLRGLMEAEGLRCDSEARLAAPLSGHDGLWRWSMAAR